MVEENGLKPCRDSCSLCGVLCIRIYNKKPKASEIIFVSGKVVKTALVNGSCFCIALMASSGFLKYNALKYHHEKIILSIFVILTFLPYTLIRHENSGALAGTSLSQKLPELSLTPKKT